MSAARRKAPKPSWLRDPWKAIPSLVLLGSLTLGAIGWVWAADQKLKKIDPIEQTLERVTDVLEEERREKRIRYCVEVEKRKLDACLREVAEEKDK
jgi:hypothetical protein